MVPAPLSNIGYPGLCKNAFSRAFAAGNRGPRFDPWAIPEPNELSKSDEVTSANLGRPASAR
jgi:hypothetical protein